MAVIRLSEAHHAQVARLIAEDPLQNLFLQGFLDAATLSRGFWYGVERRGELTAIAVLVADRLCVPWAPSPVDARAIGSRFRQEQRPCMLVGPRLACDALWSAWGDGRVQPERLYDQRLYTCDRADAGPRPAGFRPADASEWRVVARYSSDMEREDLGREPYALDPDAHEQVIRDRIRQGKTWVIDEDGEIVFLINVGTTTSAGAQVGGTFVPPPHRGRGLAQAGMRALLDVLLVRVPVVTLHVNEANTAAVRVYEATGFIRGAPFRLITVPPPPEVP